MKVFAQNYVWWPEFDSDIKKLIKQCFGCQKNQNMSAIAPLHHWEWRYSPKERVRKDFAELFLNIMFCLV